MFGRRGRGERREPVLEAPGSFVDLRLSADDRPAYSPAPLARERAGASNKSRPGNPPRATARRRRDDDWADAEDAEYEDEPRETRRNRRDDRRGGRRGRRGKGGCSGFGRLVYWGVVLALWGAIGLAGLIAYEASQLPPIQNLAIPERPPTVVIQGTDGKAIATRGEMGGTNVPLRALPPYLPQAFVAIEDRRFYSHFGLDPVGLARAVFVNLTRGRLREGGSTLTQQLAKNLFLTQERTLSRKVQELILSLWLEAKYSKNEILELYMNRVYFGAGAYGVEAAAQRYFGKSARQVTLSEAAMLAGLVKSPSALAPTRNLEGAQNRAEVVLAAMLDAGFITPEMRQTALARPATLAKTQSADSYGYVADWVMDQLKTLVGPVTQDMVVQTSVDPALQAAADKALKDALAKSGKKLGVDQGAIVLMDPAGGVHALVGGRSYEESQYNRAVSARRQPGSAFKPFVYLTAMERGLTPETIRDDAPIQIKGWKPENFSKEYRGAVDLKTALALSLNTVAVRLALEVGPDEVVKTAHRLGIASKLEPNASIALGTSEVSVLEMASAYAPFANGGVGVTPHIIERVRDKDGRVIYAYAESGRGMVMAPPHVAMINRMLRETLITGTARRADLPGWPAAGKTGTSQDYRDAWFVGYTGRYVASVWLGNDDSSPTKKAGGSGLPVEIWSQVMKAAHKDQPVVALPGAGFDGTPPPGQLPPGEVPEDPVVTGGPQRAPAPRPGLDNWLLDKLFGRG
ncbi:transglycosylase domain-containing protein [Ancylobacter sp. TS-1]|uniref:transglycosylase domain-containing protein n=1 Tax=Ancylobacter sp. TS-1 TaxID=1850374 RepID=UPI001265D515|nr:penicillin-binding protein 1A [Ancylobacter sp. TS-1]QFR34345.1 PBP1A family penicillin-binding protein [Ancylobacter sp. TS-1]